MFCVPKSVKTKETNPTRPGYPTPCKQSLRKLRAEKEQFAARESERRQVCNNETRGPKFMKIREMRESEDMDDYFRVFEMTAMGHNPYLRGTGLVT